MESTKGIEMSYQLNRNHPVCLKAVNISSKHN